MKKQALKSTDNAVYALNYHLVLVTKYRRKVFTQTMLDRACEIARDICQKFGCELIEANGEADHLHLLIDMIPAVHPVRLVNSMKTVTSRRLRKEYPDRMARFYHKPVLWSPSYCLITCGGAPMEIIRQYVENQKGA
jgi:putative transposase